MAKITAAQLVESCKKRLGWGYVLGGQGELYSEAMAREFYDKYHEKSLSYYANDCARWFGHYIVDCSGLVIEAFRDHIPGYSDQIANDLYAGCTEKGPIANAPDIPGICVWKKGHIGIYIGGGKVIESRGKDYGVVTTTLKARDFTNWGKLRDVDYAGTAGPAAQPVVPSPSIPPLEHNLHKGDKGDQVRMAQEQLAFHKAQPGKIDGIFGKRTRDAVIRFQKARIAEGHDLGSTGADGVIGPLTWPILMEGRK